ncbi:hypothetical protein J8273_0343 [Carpediemonas membranifera]|uniref:Uncharacterized protein n=1 Tax=Carpediemonas membranifera TaxID=201153 RepID=A0A8J6E0H4_9EUKA|nr:hypothetical protein J8273_0343 [Carpediemonas membranifera]|eukprot:KAG9395124.1 hypothetical protein J8273_0343 [Carpediemonas membranifera]
MAELQSPILSSCHITCSPRPRLADSVASGPLNTIDHDLSTENEIMTEYREGRKYMQKADYGIAIVLIGVSAEKFFRAMLDALLDTAPLVRGSQDLKSDIATMLQRQKFIPVSILASKFQRYGGEAVLEPYLKLHGVTWREWHRTFETIRSLRNEHVHEPSVSPAMARRCRAIDIRLVDKFIQVAVSATRHAMTGGMSPAVQLSSACLPCEPQPCPSPGIIHRLGPGVLLAMLLCAGGNQEPVSTVPSDIIWFACRSFLDAVEASPDARRRIPVDNGSGEACHAVVISRRLLVRTWAGNARAYRVVRLPRIHGVRYDGRAMVTKTARGVYVCRFGHDSRMATTVETAAVPMPGLLGRFMAGRPPHRRHVGLGIALTTEFLVVSSPVGVWVCYNDGGTQQLPVDPGSWDSASITASPAAIAVHVPAERALFVMGANSHGELGLGHSVTASVLTKVPVHVDAFQLGPLRSLFSCGGDVLFAGDAEPQLRHLGLCQGAHWTPARTPWSPGEVHTSSSGTVWLLARPGEAHTHVVYSHGARSVVFKVGVVIGMHRSLLFDGHHLHTARADYLIACSTDSAAAAVERVCRLRKSSRPAGDGMRLLVSDRLAPGTLRADFGAEDMCSLS